MVQEQGLTSFHKWRTPHDHTIEIIDLSYRAVIAQLEYDQPARILRLNATAIKDDGLQATLPMAYHDSLILSVLESPSDNATVKVLGEWTVR